MHILSESRLVYLENSLRTEHQSLTHVILLNRPHFKLLSLKQTKLDTCILKKKYLRS